MDSKEVNSSGRATTIQWQVALLGREVEAAEGLIAPRSGEEVVEEEEEDIVRRNCMSSPVCKWTRETLQSKDCCCAWVVVVVSARRRRREWSLLVINIIFLLIRVYTMYTIN
jgi:hypothetical protein